MKRLVDFGLFSAIYIAVCAIALCMETNILLKLPFNHWSFYCFIAGACLVQYNLHYFFKQATGFPSERDVWSIHNRTTQKIFLAAGLILILLSVNWLQPRHFIVLLVLAGLASLYSLPLLPFKKRRLKEYGLFKIILLSLEWTLVTVWFPVDQSGIDPTSYWLVFFRRFVFMFVLCLLFDIRDLQTDKANGIRTLPVRIGIKNAYRLADLTLLLFVLLSAWQLSRTGEFIFFNAMLLSAICTKWIMQLSKKINNDYVYLAGVDGMMLLQALLVAVGTI
jgi:4-hydroxybenzoate polyprenyltransferase